MRYTPVLTLLALVLAGAASSAQQAAAPDWKPFAFLVGDWTAGGGGQPGQATGSFSFHFDLDRRILVRRNIADYPATAEKAAFHHEDLMVIYPDSSGEVFRATFWDNEGHVINYTTQFSSDGGSITFVSDSKPSAPRFRLSYRKTGDNALAGKFELASPGKPDAFAAYLEWTAQKRAESRTR